MNAETSGAPIKLGICGLGYGLYHAKRLICSPNGAFVDIRAVCDGDAHRLQAGVSALNCPGYSSLAEMLDSADIEAVALFSPPGGRAELVSKIIARGKDVMTTKPFELDPEAALRVLQDAQSRGRHVFLNSPAPVLGDDLVQILDWQREHDLGQLIFTQADCWYRSIQNADGTWYDNPVLCPAAPILRLGIYGINDVMAFSSDLKELHVNLARVRTLRPTPDVGQLSLRFANGSMACIRATWCSGPIRDNQVSEFVFERGVVRRDYSSRDHLEAEFTTVALEAINQAGVIFRRSASISNLRTNSAYRWDLFHAAIRKTRDVMAISPEQVVAGIRIIRALTKAAAGNGVWRA